MARDNRGAVLPSARTLHFNRYYLAKAIGRLERLGEDRHASDLRMVLASYGALTEAAEAVRAGRVALLVALLAEARAFADQSFDNGSGHGAR